MTALFIELHAWRRPQRRKTRLTSGFQLGFITVLGSMGELSTALKVGETFYNNVEAVAYQAIAKSYQEIPRPAETSAPQS